MGVAGHLGLGTPIGVGVSFDYAPLRWLSVDAGVGHSTAGVQFAAGARGRLFLGKRFALSLGVAGSLGEYTWVEDRFFGGHGETEKHWDRAYWVNGDVGIEVSGQTGWFWRFYFGLGLLLNPDDYTCPPDTAAHCLADHAEDGESVRYLGLMIGRSI